MTSNDIYTPIKPTYLYIKQHSVTKKKYFGKTTRPDPIKYLGSGVYWTAHINKHGEEHIITLWVSEPYIDKELLSEFALFFSEEYDIVESEEWANLKPENGLDGGVPGMTHSAETKAKMSAAKKGKTQSAEHLAKLAASRTGRTGRTHSDETKAKMSASRTGKKRGPHSAESKAKISAAKKDKPHFKSSSAKSSSTSAMNNSIILNASRISSLSANGYNAHSLFCPKSFSSE